MLPEGQLYFQYYTLDSSVKHFYIICIAEFASLFFGGGGGKLPVRVEFDSKFMYLSSATPCKGTLDRPGEGDQSSQKKIVARPTMVGIVFV